MTAIQGGAALPVLQSNQPAAAGAAIPIAVVSDGRAVQAGPARSIVVVTDGRPVQAGAALPVVLATGALICDNTRFVGTVGAAAGTAVDISVNADISVQATLVRVLGNRFTGGFTAVSIAGAESCEVADNAISQLTHASAAAIRLAHYTTTYSARYNVIANNQLRDIRQGILVSGSGSVSANVNRVVNNEIIEGGSVNLANGILETSPADNNDYFQNTIVGATTGITVAGAGSVNSNNRVIP